MSLMLSVALPVWHTVARREREEELIFRGNQYVRAIELFQRKYAGTFPPNVDALLQGRFLRRRYLDPITNDEFQVLYAGIPTATTRRGTPAVEVSTNGRRGILGVASRSRDTSLRLYRGRNRYSEWLFVAETQQTEGHSVTR
ncbi:MAG: hypothetical protein HOP16_15435 [Acidobacteria bacterium]|nr:hypothetical protein [Acidobacteriota bacterium]